ncbi:corticotropin-releasing factor receptor 1-like [Haliotis cracherodii]|uniref:corticotropin-releasing factor receptor 1-like n=1 Tax=Haliotis cracherodii TaxID=6455 RepID=UPI0039E93461
MDLDLIREHFPTASVASSAQCCGIDNCIFDEAHICKEDPGVVYCNSTFDTVSCWPPTPEGILASIPCPQGLIGVDPTKNASRLCDVGGIWANKSNYNDCLTVYEEHRHVDGLTPDKLGVRVIYNVGFTVTTVALVVALVIFLYFRSLRCLRNKIHCHLIVTFILQNVMWVLMHNTLLQLWRTKHEWICKIIVTLYNYFHGTNFFWMFVEGLYLFTIIVWAYSADKIKLWHYMIVGWGIPFIYTIVWAVVRSTLDDFQCWLPSDTHYDYILHVPIFWVLVSNILFLSAIIWVLITKLKASHNLETRQYRKAVKATIILFPLLGVTYVLFLIPPSNDHVVQTVFQYANAFLQSFQGLFVAVFYCFLNGEVRAAIRKKLSNYQESRSIVTRYTKTSFVGSPARSTSNYNQSLQMSTCNGGKQNGCRGKRPSESSRGMEEEAENML